MELLKFKDKSHYENVQLATVRMRKKRASFRLGEIRLSCEWLKSHSITDSNGVKGLCHGVRSGLESDVFLRYFPLATIIGTDLFPMEGAYYKSLTPVVKWNFSEVNPDWIGKMDFVYSNSLDHSDCPETTIRIWLEQIKPTGFLLLRWGLHGFEKARRGDCFTASYQELADIINRIGRVVNVIKLYKSRKNTYLMLICQRQDASIATSLKT